MKKLFLLSLSFFAALKAQAFVVYGDSVSLGNGKARAYADIDRYGNPKSVGFAISEKALEGLPEHNETEYSLRLPSILQIFPYDHMAINWEPHGHTPDNIYGLPHFDFHFYFIPEALRKTITCTGNDFSVCMAHPDPSKIPAFYVPTPEGVPQMGWHWVDPRSPEFNGKPFTTTFLYGFYNANMIFAEPMMTRDFLLKKENFVKEIPGPQVWPGSGYYPKAYSLEYKADLKMYFISLRNLEYKDYK